MSAVVMKYIQIAPSGHDKIQVSKGNGSSMENAGSVRQDFDTGSKPGDLVSWRCAVKLEREARGIMTVETNST